MQETLAQFLGREDLCWRRDTLPTPVFLGFPCGSAGKPTPVFWPEEFHGLYGPWGCKESDMTEWLSLSCTYINSNTDNNMKQVILAFSSVQLLSHVQLFATPWTAAHQASLSITNSPNLLKLMSIGSVMPSNYLILCRPLLLLPSIFPSIRVFSNKSVLHIKWPKYWSFSFNISPSNKYSGLISFRIDCSPRDSPESFPTPQFKSINS